MDGAIKFLSVCSGIEAASVAWNPLGWQAAAVAEIDPFACFLLHHRHGAGRPMFMPDPAHAKRLRDQRARKAALKAISALPAAGAVPNFGDLEQFRKWPDAAIDLLVGGTPCQSFSVAGLRKGLDDPRGNLALVYLAIAERYRPRWIVWENVPGVLSSNKGRDFGAFIGALGHIGYGWAYRVLDAQYVRTRRFRRAVPQRRRRVFVVGYLGSWQRAAAVLFDAQSLRGDPAPRREAGQRTAPTIGGGPASGSVSGTVSCKWAKGSGGPSGNETCNMIAQPIAFSAKDHGADAVEGIAPTLRAGGHSESHANAGVMPAVAFQERGREDGRSLEYQEEIAYALTSPTGGTRAQERNVATPWAVRRLTPRECERLQGFEDDYTLIPYRNGRPAADGPRYKALGNSMAVNAMDWIGQRMRSVDAIT